MIVYRICKAKYAHDAFSGAGGLDAAGRWHRKGQPVVYTAGTLSLSALEYFVHLGRLDTRISFVSVSADIPDEIRQETIDTAALPPDWKTSPPLDAPMQLGSRWCAELRSAILKVPSAMVPGEFNFLLTPRHPDFPRITLSAPERFFFDPRSWK
jgi:RES domain-containing protein